MLSNGLSRFARHSRSIFTLLLAVHTPFLCLLSRHFEAHIARLTATEFTLAAAVSRIFIALAIVRVSKLRRKTKIESSEYFFNIFATFELVPILGFALESKFKVANDKVQESKKKLILCCFIFPLMHKLN